MPQTTSSAEMKSSMVTRTWETSTTRMALRKSKKLRRKVHSQVLVRLPLRSPSPTISKTSSSTRSPGMEHLDNHSKTIFYQISILMGIPWISKTVKQICITPVLSSMLKAHPSTNFQSKQLHISHSLTWAIRTISLSSSARWKKSRGKSPIRCPKLFLTISISKRAHHPAPFLQQVEKSSLFHEWCLVSRLQIKYSMTLSISLQSTAGKVLSSMKSM